MGVMVGGTGLRALCRRGGVRKLRLTSAGTAAGKSRVGEEPWAVRKDYQHHGILYRARLTPSPIPPPVDPSPAQSY